MDFVAPSVAIGSLADASSELVRRGNGIEAVLSLLETVHSFGPHHARMPIRDGERIPADLARAAVDFIAAQIKAGRKVLVHCQMGMSRSPAIVAGYLSSYGGMTLEASLEWVCRHRTVAAPHPVLVDSLYEIFGGESTATVCDRRLVDISANENPLGPSPRAIAAMESASRASHRYPDRQGRALREALAKRHLLNIDQLVLGNGSCELLDLVARANLQPGDEALIFTPSFLPYQSAIRRAYGKLVTVPLGNGFACDFGRMASLAGPNTRLVILGHPNNPTGVALGAAALERFLDNLPPEVVVVIDEAYREYVSQSDAADAMALVRAGRPVVALRTFSKLHALAGLRIGYAAARPDIAARIESLRPHYNTSSIAQAAAFASLEDKVHVANTLAVNRSGLAELRTACSRFGLECVPSSANFLLVRTGAADQITCALEKHGVRVKSGAVFGLPDHIRISVGTPACNRRFIDALGEVLRDLGGNQQINLKEGAQVW